MIALDQGVVQRLRSARGHLEAVTRMAEQDQTCLSLLHQLSAVQGALSAVRRELLEQHLRECFEAAIESGVLDDLVDELLTAAYGTGVRPA